MWSSLADLAPVLLLIGLGVVLRLTGIVTEQSRLVLTRVAYYVTIPVAILVSIAQAELTPQMLLLPVIGFLLPVLLSGVMYLLTRKMTDRAARGTMLISMVGLVMFGYPISQVYYGTAGVTRVAMYDIGNVLYISTVALWIAQSYGTRGRRGVAAGFIAILKSPFIWAAVIGVTLALLRLPIRGIAESFLQRLAAANTPIVMMAVGTYLRLKLKDGRRLLVIAAVRMLLGGVLAWLAALALGMSHLDIAVVTLAASLPVGTTPLIYSSAENLDPELAAAAFSTTVLVSVVVVSLLPSLMALAYPAG